MRNFYFLCAFIFILIFSNCEYFLEPEVANEAIVREKLKWNQNDEYPLFLECEESTNKKRCFQNTLSELLSENILNEGIFANPELETTLINLLLKVNDKGEFSLLEINAPNSLDESIPFFKEKTEAAVNNLPIINPAFKKNAGIAVSIQFEIPILISPEE